MLSIETDTNLVVIGVPFGNYVVSAWLSHGVHGLFEGIDGQTVHVRRQMDIDHATAITYLSEMCCPVTISLTAPFVTVGDK